MVRGRVTWYRTSAILLVATGVMWYTRDVTKCSCVIMTKCLIWKYGIKLAEEVTNLWEQSSIMFQTLLRIISGARGFDRFPGGGSLQELFI